MTQQLRFECIKNLDQAKILWNKLTPNDSVEDTWDMRNCFYSYYKYELFFYAGYLGDVCVGLLPLQFNSESACLEFFGGYYFSDNQVFILPGYEQYIPDFFKQINKSAHLEDIVGDSEYIKNLPLSYYKYIVPLSGFSSYNDFLNTKFKSKDRTNLKRKIKIMENEKIDIIVNCAADLDLMIDYNISHFKEKSCFNKPFRRKNFFHDLLKLPFNIQLLTFVVNGKKEAVSFSILHNKTYTFIHYGKSMDRYPHISTYVTMQNIQNAIKQGAHIFDAGVQDFGWKESWQFDKILQYHYYTD